MSITIGDTVHYHREGAYSFQGEVLTLNEGSNRVLVQWVDCLGNARQTLVGVEYLRVMETATALTVKTVNAA